MARGDGDRFRASDGQGIKKKFKYRLIQSGYHPIFRALLRETVLLYASSERNQNE